MIDLVVREGDIQRAKKWNRLVFLSIQNYLNKNTHNKLTYMIGMRILQRI